MVPASACESSTACETMLVRTDWISRLPLTASPDLAERPELVHGAGQLLRPRLQLLEQAHVLDRDHRLVGEGLEQSDLLVGERFLLGPAEQRSAPIGSRVSRIRDR